MRSRNSSPFSPDPPYEDVPFNVDELAAMAGDIPRSLDRNSVAYLIRRALATAAQLRRVRSEFDNELRRRSAMIPSTGGALVAANPEVAARFLSPEQLRGLFDKFAQERLAALEEAKANADAAAERSNAVVAEISRLADAPGTDPLVAAQLRSVLAQLTGGAR